MRGNVMSKKYVITEQKDHSGWWIILIAAFLVAYGYVILAFVIAVGVSWLGYQLWKWYKPRRKVRQVEESNYYLDAPTQLITEGMRVWGDPEHYLDNYNDGMRDWR
jgi:hypothetical protein